MERDGIRCSVGWDKGEAASTEAEILRDLNSIDPVDAFVSRQLQWISNKVFYFITRAPPELTRGGQDIAAILISFQNHRKWLSPSVPDRCEHVD